LLVICVAHATSMTFKYTLNDGHGLTDKWVSHELVLTLHRLTVITLLDELSTKDFHIATRLDKNTVTLDIFFIPEEEVVAVVVLDRACNTFTGTLGDPYHLIYC